MTDLSTDVPHKRILVVDDEKNIRMTLAESLSGMDLDVEAVPNGTEAIACLESERYHLMLLDIKMPGLDGMEVLRWAREHRPFMPVIMITAHGTAFNAVEAVQIGAADVIQKPFSVEEVRRHVARVLSRDTLDPTMASDYDACMELGRGRINDRQFDAAAAYVYEALRHDGTRPEAHDLLGVLYQLRGDVEEARRCFEKALMLDFSYAPAARNLRQLIEPLSPDEDPEATPLQGPEGRDTSERGTEHSGGGV